jgi:hypothetical protein
MAGVKHWTVAKNSPGIFTVTFSNYRWFFDYINTEMLDFTGYVYRGQRDSSWPIESSLDRKFQKIRTKRTMANTDTHLNNFRYATRGRLDYTRFDNSNKDEWWAIGQHYGLATPLLDWSESPFVCLFFAFEEETKSSSRFRSVYAISQSFIRNTQKDKIAKSQPDFIGIVKPQNGDNDRLVNQRGLFLSMPMNEDLESYVSKNIIDPNTSEMFLLKLLVPDVYREEVLKYLNRMNINKLTLYPDLTGVSEYTNTKLIIKRY